MAGDGIAQLALPCRLVALKVLLGPEGGLTTLEDLVARAIAAGRTTVEQLNGLFRLPARMIVDVVHSLWNKGHILVRFDTGELDLTDGARDQLMAGGLRGAAAVPETRRFLFEPVTGQFFPETQGKRFAPEGALELPAHHGVTASDLSAGDLLDAVQSAIRYDRRRTGFRQNVLDVGFGSPVLRPPDELRWLTVRVAVHMDNARGGLFVKVIDDEHTWGVRARQRLTDHLGNLAAEQPKHAFVQALVGKADRQLVVPETLDRLLDRMETRIQQLPGTAANRVGEAQKELVRLADDVAERIADADRSQAATLLVRGAPGYVWALEELVNSARTQLVISSPVIRYHALNALLPNLKERLANGVLLVLLWGRAAADELPVPVLTALNELKALFPGRVLFDKYSAQTDACVVLQDGSRGFFGSFAPLAVTTDTDHGEIGVLVEPAAEGPAMPQCVADALFWARKTYPFAIDAARILLEPDSTIAAPRRRSRYKRDPDVWLPSPPDDRADGPGLRLWAEGWGEYHASVRDSLRLAAGRKPSVELVLDGAHRDLTATALSTRSQRLAITDDRVDPRVANDDMARRIRDVASGGSTVHLVHPNTTVSGKVGKAFAELLTAQEAGIHVQRGNAGVRAVLSDDSVLLGSFSPLSESSRSVGGGHVSQVGVYIRGTEFADAFAEALGIPPRTPRAAEDSVPAPGDAQAARPNRAGRSNAALSVALPLLEQARRAPGAEGFTTVVTERLAKVDDPWLVLDRWESVDVPADELRRGVALVLGLGRSAPLQTRERWTHWLVADAWRRRAFVEAAMVGRMLTAPEDVAACAAAAVLEVGPLESLLADTAIILADSGSPARIAGAVGGMAETLLWGGAEGGQVNVMLRDALPRRWQRLAAVTAESEPGRPLPMKAFAAEMTRAADRAAADRSWADLAVHIDRIEQLRQRFDFASGLAMHDGLFVNDGLLTAIRAAALEPELRPALEGRLRLIGGGIRAYLDGLVQAAGEEPMAWRAQMSFLRKIEQIVRDARDLVSAVTEPDSVSAADELDYCRRLGSELADMWDDLFSEAGSVPQPYGQPMIALLERLQSLQNWAGERP